MAELHISVVNQGDKTEIYAHSDYQNHRVIQLGVPVLTETLNLGSGITRTLRSIDESEEVYIDKISEENIKAIGTVLFEFLFNSKEIYSLYRQHSLNNPKNTLKLDFSAYPELNNYPWEMLYDKRQDAFLGLSNKFSIIRYLPEQLVRRKPLFDRKRLNVLFVISCEPQLNVEEEWHIINEIFQSAKADSLVAIDRLESVNIETLQTKLHQFKPNILHFVGHSRYDTTNQQGSIQLTNKYDEKEVITPDDLGHLVSDNKDLLLLVLNSCQSSLSSPRLVYSGIAQRIMQMGAPAIISMQREINDSSALIFSKRFYQSIADSLPIEQAITEARKSLYQNNKVTQDWYIPTLHSRSENEIFFNFPKKQSYRDIYNSHKKQFVLIVINAILLTALLIYVISNSLYKPAHITIYDSEHQPVPEAIIDIAVLNYTGYTNAHGELTIPFFSKSQVLTFDIHKEGYISKQSQLLPGVQIHERIYKESSD